ncbi:neutral alkaline non-lysosomal ceramidase [Thermoanaerobacterium thermosaccharolyticum]|uniref:Neutral ceramidase n=1 Tax=Thermoanaerobacterium thermosaccharolyticum TaxID=1517 RepID=A0A231VCI8_THETR|nr:neutral/alkaline non-lysosomal ceramidase N-terminal domain-containing protein [Thermoanaerobacterium thermosaccharolyticum]AST56604.1 neutral alkaline non-lysosomal ceramidase [Thermoanaerobacterium thermosaccharolyticum]OXT05316.1 hypothetical protein CE561_12715 [Thermoanaerobacterium thermosaccharolyticum]
MCEVLVYKTYNIPNENILISAIHTHSAPEGFPVNLKRGLFTEKFNIDEKYQELVIDKTMQAVHDSINSLDEVCAFASKGKVKDLYGNRIQKDYLYDDDIFMIRFKNGFGKTIGAVVNFSCHPTVLGDKNYYISADFVGYMRKHLSKSLDNCLIIAMNGSAGDVSTRYTRLSQDIQEAKRIGEELANQFLLSLNESKKIELNNIKRKNLLFEFDRRLDLDITDIDKQVIKLREEMNKLTDAGDKRRIMVQLQVLENMHDLSKYELKKIVVKISIIDIGELRIISIPGELFSELGLKIKNNTNKFSLIAGYSEDYVGYIITESAYQKGGYENLVTLLPRGSSEKIVSPILNYKG